MREYFHVLLFVIASVFKSQRRLAAENVALRHQVLVLKRKHRGRIELRGLGIKPQSTSSVIAMSARAQCSNGV